MVEPSVVITIEFGVKGSSSGALGPVRVKSCETMYRDCVLAMKSTVEFVPGEVMLTGLEMTGLPLPKAPIWLYGDELQLGGWQMAKMEPAPARVGETGLVPAMVSGEVETNWSVRPVSGFPRVSIAVATSGCGVF